jgi:sugar phosphate isomerase/epimerase
MITVPMFYGYNTNGLAHHDLFEAVELLAELGYRGVAVTIDHHVLAPQDRGLRGQLARLRRRLRRLGLRSVIETGARFLLDARVKHEPTLVTADAAARARRLEFYRHAIRCAAELKSDCVSIWSGVLRESAAEGEALSRLADGLNAVLDEAARQNVAVGFEPEPGMFIDSMPRFEQLLAAVGRPELKLTLDVGHVQCQGEGPIADVIRRFFPRLVNVHLDDMCAGRHEHLMFGQGQIDFPPIFRTLSELRYAGGLYVELSRHSHDAPSAARQAIEFLSPMLRQG